MTDEELYQKARLYGQNARLWRQKFMGLLPEVARRRLYEKKGFQSIFEFAFKLAGLSEQQVRTMLNLKEHFSDKPTLKALLENGEVSINKLVRIQSIATTENEFELAQAVRILPKSALDTLVRDERKSGSAKPLFTTKSLPGQDLCFSEDVTARLLELQGKGIDLSMLLTEFLDQREEKIGKEKDEITKKLPLAKSRTVPSRIRRVIHEEYGNKCSIQTCSRPATQLHHTQTFAISQRHDPRYLAPLCKDHHVLAHAINLKVQEKRRLSTI